jgi:hypothetical protein
MINRKIPDCVRVGAARLLDVACRRQSRCLLYSHNPHLICAVHPEGVDSDRCPDFRPTPNAEEEEQWQPEGYSWYGGELIANRPSRYTQEQQLGILDTHPFFTLQAFVRLVGMSLIRIISQRFTTIALFVVGLMMQFIERDRSLNLHLCRSE